MNNRRTVNGPAIRAWRQERGMSLRELAEKIDYDYGHLGRIERGQRTASQLLVSEIAKALNVASDALTMPEQRKAAAA